MSKAYIKTDRFGQPYQLKRAKQVKTKSGDTLNIYKAFFELNGRLYEVEVSPSNKSYDDGLDSMWCKVTKKEKNKRHQSM